MNDANANDVYT